MITGHLLPSPRRLASGEGIVVLGVCVRVCVCPPSRDCTRVALVSAAKVMRCTHCMHSDTLFNKRILYPIFICAFCTFCTIL